jgi:hypothetical protein
MLLTSVALSQDIQIPTDPDTAKALLEQGYTPIILQDNQGNKALILTQGYTQVSESEIQSRNPLVHGIILIIEYIWGAEPLNEGEHTPIPGTPADMYPNPNEVEHV